MKNCQYGIFTKNYYDQNYTDSINNFSTILLKTLLKMFITCPDFICFNRVSPLFRHSDKKFVKKLSNTICCKCLTFYTEWNIPYSVFI